MQHSRINMHLQILIILIIIVIIRINVKQWHSYVMHMVLEG